MFTGIIELVGMVKKIEKGGNYLLITICHKLPAGELKIGDSVACDGACLTLVSSSKGEFSAEVSQETIARTIVGNYRRDSRINLERAMCVGDRLDGHFVTGHIDDTANIKEVNKIGESLYLMIQYDSLNDNLIVEKGSIAINGVSLTVNEAGRGWCSVNLVPHTLEHTNLSELKLNEKVNIEFDLIGKYATKAAVKENRSTLTFAKLEESGW